MSSEIEEEIQKEKKPKFLKSSATFLRNALRSNLDLMALADKKAGILISINGFILTVSVTASGFSVHNTIMTYAFVAIILTSLGSIIFSVLAVKPRNKNILNERAEGYSSLLYYQDMADLGSEEYVEAIKKSLKSDKRSIREMSLHLHILASEIKKKYFWLKQAYTFFSFGLIVSAALIIYALVGVEHSPFYNLSTGNIIYKKDKFYNIFEPSGLTTLPDGKVLVVEDEGGTHALKLLSFEGAKVNELGELYFPKDIRKFFKKGVEDIEAITSNGNDIYATTSHSLSRLGKEKASREMLLYFTYEDGAIKELYKYKNLKSDLQEHFPKLFSPSLLKSNSINIEGISYNTQSKSLIIGFRSPLYNGDAILVEVTNPKAIFLKGDKPLFSQAIFLNFNGGGIRDFSYDSEKDGYWVVAGSVDKRNFQFTLWFVDAKTLQAKELENYPDIGYGEGITLFKNSVGESSLLIVEDNGKKPNKPADYVVIDKESLE